MEPIFKDFDFSNFWNDSAYALKEYVEKSPSDQLILSIEKELGYKLPRAYVEMMKMHNGGIPFKTCFPTTEATSWAEDHMAISGIMGIGDKQRYSICGALGSQFMIEEWGYPTIGICICTCPSAGHDMVMLDYSRCGNDGEPQVVHVDQESGFKVTFLAKDFESFIRGLVSEDVYDTSEEDLNADLAKIENGAFSGALTGLLSRQTDLEYGNILRRICRQLTEAKGYFALHADEQSRLVYDIQFLLVSKAGIIGSKEEYLKKYPALIAFGDGQFTTGGYAPSFVEDWLNESLSANRVTNNASGGLEFSKSYQRELNQKLKQYE